MDDGYAEREAARAERELEDWFDEEILERGHHSIWELENEWGWDSHQPEDDETEIKDFLAQGGWHIEYTDPLCRGVAGELWPQLDPEEAEEGWRRADQLIDQWARNAKERAFLEALAAGHTQGEASRLSGLMRPDNLLRRIRDIGNKPPKGEGS